MSNYRKRQKRDRRRAIIASRVEPIKSAARGAISGKRVDAPSLPKRLTRPSKALVTPSMVRDVKPVRLPVAARTGHLTDKVQAPRTLPRSAAVLSRATIKAPAPVVARRPLPPRAAAVVAAKRPDTPRKAPAPPLVSPPLKPALAARKSLALHSPTEKKSNSVQPRKAGLSTCKERPKFNKPSGGSGGGSRAFVPWCG